MADETKPTTPAELDKLTIEQLIDQLAGSGQTDLARTLEDKLAMADALERKETEFQKELAAARAEKFNDTSPNSPVNVGLGYKYTVGPARPVSGLEPAEVVCCDETEAIRWYVFNHKHPDPAKKGRRLRSTDFAFKVTIDPESESRRNDRIRFQNKIARIRRALLEGRDVTKAEIKELDKYDDVRTANRYAPTVMND